jgi:hypothetical protein
MPGLQKLCLYCQPASDFFEILLVFKGSTRPHVGLVLMHMHVGPMAGELVPIIEWDECKIPLEMLLATTSA